MATSEADNAYPALRWEEHAVKAAVKRYQDSLQWYEDTVGLARYAGVPLGTVFKGLIHVCKR
jgi:hypothetical protein